MFRTVLLAIAASAALSTAAFAAHVENPHNINHPSSREQMSDRCSALESQYDTIINGQLSGSKADKAQGLYSQGVGKCNSNETDIGVQKLQQALRVLNVKPAA